MIRCYVTDRRQGDVIAYAQRAIADGVDMIQIREKDLTARQLLELVAKVRDLAAGTPTRVLVNDRLDVALASGINAVHLPANGLPPAEVRPLVKVLGVSTHTLQEAIDAERACSDFILFGPIFDTPGKAAVGIGKLREITSRLSIPVLAIGGITSENTQQVLDAGARGIAGIRLFQR